MAGVPFAPRVSRAIFWGFLFSSAKFDVPYFTSEQEDFSFFPVSICSESNCLESGDSHA